MAYCYASVVQWDNKDRAQEIRKYQFPINFMPDHRQRGIADSSVARRPLGRCFKKVPCIMMAEVPMMPAVMVEVENVSGHLIVLSPPTASINSKVMRLCHLPQPASINNSNAAVKTQADLESRLSREKPCCKYSAENVRDTVRVIISRNSGNK